MPPTIVITGASSGIGEALALRYASERARLGLLGRNRERLDGVAAECRRHGAEAHVAAIDVRARSEIRGWLEDFDRATPVDVLIANAGVMAGRPPDGKIEPPDDSHALIETNVLGVLNAICVAEVILLPPRVGSHIFGWHQPSVVTKRCEFAAQMVCADASLHADETRRHGGKPGCYLATRPLLAQGDRATPIETHNVK